ncbi:MAG: alpha/beta fold hydrolase [Candidatus Tectomicrobia bacterium]|nr:alpha/beta fold hydrolase [Candidatus Tectomicrobia bacterium]
MYFPENRNWSSYFMRLVGEAPQGAADFNECHRVSRRTREGNEEDWHTEWRREAERLERLAGEAEARGHAVTAHDFYLRACSYYRAAEFMLPPADGRKLPTYLRGTDCFQKAGRHFRPPLEAVRVPYEDAHLHGYFFPSRSGGPGRTPALVYFGGADSNAEELYFLGTQEALKRGVACLTVDGPGQGETLRLLGVPSRPDYEVAVRAAVDYLARRPEVDPDRIGLIGVSMGGYYAPRGAAFDPRVRACVAYGACFDVLADLYDFFPPIRDQMQWLVGAETPEEARRKLGAFTLEGVARRITCPLLIVHGEEDYIVSPEAAQKTYDAAGGPKELRIWKPEEGGAAHCNMDNTPQVYPYIFDWLADRLGQGAG